MENYSTAFMGGLSDQTEMEVKVWKARAMMMMMMTIMTLINLMKTVIMRLTEMEVHCSQRMNQTRYRCAHLSHASEYLACIWA